MFIFYLHFRYRNLTNCSYFLNSFRLLDDSRRRNGEALQLHPSVFTEFVNLAAFDDESSRFIVCEIVCFDCHSSCNFANSDYSFHLVFTSLLSFCIYYIIFYYICQYLFYIFTICSHLDLIKKEGRFLSSCLKDYIIEFN